MTTFALVSSRFPDGTTVYANPVNLPHVSPVSAVASGGEVVFSKLRGDEDYVAHATVAGAYREVNFRSRYESDNATIDMVAEGVPTDGVSDCAATIESVKTRYPTGGRLVFPPGVFRILSPVDLTAQPWSVEGHGSFTTTLHCPVDADNAMLVLGAGRVRIAHLSLVGPTEVVVGNVASAPLKRGVVLRDRARVEGVRVEAFGTGIVIDGNHQSLENVQVTNCKRNIAWAQNQAGFTTAVAASFTHGNQTIVGCDFVGAGEASCYVAGDSKIDGSDIIGTHLGFAPHGILLGAANGQTMSLGGGTNMIGVSFESCGLNYIEDLGWNTANRRLSKGLRWIAPRTGPQDPTYDPAGQGGTEMVKIGTITDWLIEGVVGDNSNTSFGSVGFGTTSTACGFRFESCTGLIFRNADTLWNNATAQSKPMFRMEGAAQGFSDIWLSVFSHYRVMILTAGATLTDGQIVCPSAKGDPWVTTVKVSDGTAAALGRAAGGPLTSGLLVAVVTHGAFNTLTTTDTTITAGSALVPDASNAGKVKKQSALGQQIIGVALNDYSSGTVQATLTGPYQPAL